MIMLLPVGRSMAATSWEVYLDHPTPENASRVDAIAYSGSPSARSQRYEFFDLLLLDQQIQSGDIEAARLAVRVYRQSKSAANQEYLAAFLASSIRSHPAMFLKLAVRESLSKDELWSFLTPTGEAFVDRDAAQRYELEARIAALSTVNDPALREKKSYSIEQLKRAIAPLFPR